jgi:hypothetical protein
MSATNVARSGRRRCFNRPAPLLQSPGVSATIIRRHDYKTAAAALLQPPATLLKVVGRSATIAWHRCYKPAAALLQPPGAAATRCGSLCYNLPSSMLQAVGGAATIVWCRCYDPLGAAATSRRWHCYNPPAPLLQSLDAVATLVRRHCCMGLQSVRRCCCEASHRSLAGIFLQEFAETKATPI